MLRGFDLNNSDSISSTYGKALKTYRGFGVAAFLFFIFFALSVQYKEDNQEAVRPLYLIGLFLLLVALLITLLRQKKLGGDVFRLYGGAASPFLIIFFLYIFLSAILAGMRELKDVLYFLYWYLLFSLVLWFVISNQLQPINFSIFVSKVVVVFALFSGVVAILVFLNILSIDLGWYKLQQSIWVAGRIHGFMGEPTTLGGILGLGLLSLNHIGRSWKSSVRWLAIILLCVCLLWSGSRNAVVSLIVALFLYWILGTRYEFRLVLKRCFVVLSVLFLAVMLLFSSFSSELKLLWVVFDRADYSDTDENSRLFIWGKVFEIFTNGTASEILFGRGFGGIREAYRSPFNSFLEIAVDFGLIGFSIYILFVMTTVLVGLKKYLDTQAEIYRFGLSLFFYSATFSLFISLIPTPFFNFVAFSMLFGLVLISIPKAPKRANSKTLALNY